MAITKKKETVNSDPIKAYNLENRLKDVRERPQELYMPSSEGFQSDLYELRDRLKSNNLKDFAISAVGGPGAYLLWRLPLRWHKGLNKALDGLVDASALLGRKDATLALGIASGVSKTLYGLKSKSGKYVVEGMTHTLKHAEKIDHPKVKQSATMLREVLDYIAKFNPKKVSGLKVATA
jgi:hypothetical protein